MTTSCLEHTSNTCKAPFIVCSRLTSQVLCMPFWYVMCRCSHVCQPIVPYRVTTIHGLKLSMHLTASNRRLFQTSLNGTMLIWQSKRFVSWYSSSILMYTFFLVFGKPKVGFQLTLQRSPKPRKLVYFKLHYLGTFWFSRLDILPTLPLRPLDSKLLREPSPWVVHHMLRSSDSVNSDFWYDDK